MLDEHFLVLSVVPLMFKRLDGWFQDAVRAEIVEALLIEIWRNRGDLVDLRGVLEALDASLGLFGERPILEEVDDAEVVDLLVLFTTDDS